MNFSIFFNKLKIDTLLIFIFNFNTIMAQNTIRPIKDAKGIEVGDFVKDFDGEDIHSKHYSLASALRNGPVVLIFIRGQWCPFCNKHLAEVQDSLSLIYDKGASVVVISPEKSEFIKKTIDKTGAEFTILFDNGYKISDAFDVTYKPDSMQRFVYNNVLGAKLKEAHSDNSERLPIPATFIIGKDGKVVWRQFDPNYKKRSMIAEILMNIPKSK